MPNKGRSHRLRIGRASIEGQIYLLTTVTHGRRRLFEDFEVACLASRTLSQLRLWHDADLLAWVLMPDHLHLLVRLGPGGTLPRLMQRVKAVIALEVGRSLGTRGIWLDGYHDRAIRNDEDLREYARYVIANPVRAELVRRVGEYPFWDAVWVGDRAEPLDP